MGKVACHVGRKPNDRFQGHVRLVLSIVRITLDEGTGRVLVGPGDCMYRHHAFHKLGIHLLTGSQGVFRAVSTNGDFEIMSNMACCIKHSGSLSATVG